MMADDVNEIEAAARAHKRGQDAARANSDTAAAKADHWPIVPIAIGVGVGSAALAAALLYAGRDRKK